MKLSVCIFLLLLLNLPIFSQAIIGRVIDHEQNPLPNLNLTLYIENQSYVTKSDSQGVFEFSNLLSADESIIPSGYAISNNFPNPFNPTTRFVITLPVNGNVKISTYNLLGEKVVNDLTNEYSTGTYSIDLKLDGLPNGVYFAKISVDDKFTVIRKMMLIYGSQHLLSSGTWNNHSYIDKGKNGKIALSHQIDSLVVSSKIIGRKVFKDLPAISEIPIDIGNLIIERFCPGTPTIEYEGIIYHTVQIGEQFWLKENLKVGNIIQGNQNSSQNGIIEKYCYDNDPNNCTAYGGLYQWNEALQITEKESSQGICPPGWHIPTKEEFETLIETVDNNSDFLKAFADNENSNASGFSALFGGYRNPQGNFGMLEKNTSFWLSSQYFNGDAYYAFIRNNNTEISIDFCIKDFAFSIRCIKD